MIDATVVKDAENQWDAVRPSLQCQVMGILSGYCGYMEDLLFGSYSF